MGRQVLGDGDLDAAVVIDGEVVLHHALAEGLLAHQLRPVTVRQAPRASESFGGGESPQLPRIEKHETVAIGGHRNLPSTSCRYHQRNANRNPCHLVCERAVPVSMG